MITRGVYRHYKGGLYWVEHVALDGAADHVALDATAAMHGAIVIYYRLEDAVRDFATAIPRWRTVKNFTEMVEVTVQEPLSGAAVREVPRFAPVDMNITRKLG